MGGGPGLMPYSPCIVNMYQNVPSIWQAEPTKLSSQVANSSITITCKALFFFDVIEALVSC